MPEAPGASLRVTLEIPAQLAYFAKAGRQFAQTTPVAEMSTLPSIPSPCIAVCRLDPKSGLCIGCFRTIEEIGLWPTASDSERLQMLDRLKDRRRAAGRTSAADSRPRRRRGRRPASND